MAINVGAGSWAGKGERALTVAAARMWLKGAVTQAGRGLILEGCQCAFLDFRWLRGGSGGVRVGKFRQRDDREKLSARSLRSWIAFQDRVAELGGEVVEPAWLGSTARHRVRCARGHETTCYPGNVAQGAGICLTCAGGDPTAAWAAFRARVVELGGKVLEPTWLGKDTPHRVRCVSGHEVTPRPGKVRDGGGICRICSGKDPETAWVAFRARVTELGGEVLEPAWLGNSKPHRVQCANGHEGTPRPSNVLRGQGICRTCVGKVEPAVAWDAFRARVVELGGEVLEGAWLGAQTTHRVRCSDGHIAMVRPDRTRKRAGICQTCHTQAQAVAWDAFRARVVELGGEVLVPAWLGSHSPHKVRCADNHESQIRPEALRNGGEICRTCPGTRQAAAWAAFKERVAELGGEVLESAPLGALVAHRVRCGAGHEGKVRPNSVQQGQGICRICAGTDQKTAWEAFRARVAELGGEVLEPAPLGKNMPHRVRCAEGHEVTPRPNGVQQGQGICRICAGKDPKTAWAKFRARVIELGGEVLEPAWLGSSVPHRVRCPYGHESTPYPGNVSQGEGICRTCAGTDPAASEAKFRARVAELGGEVLEPVWLGAGTPHRIRCSNGHEATCYPTNVIRGEGICRLCRGRTWDAFYVVTDDDEGELKFGITSGSALPRLGQHARDGYTTRVRLFTGLPTGVAWDIERSVKAALRIAGERPVRGSEYFDISVIALVLDIADNHPGAPKIKTSTGVV
ncbi:hypothetical protein [Streptomyces sp. NPDC089799]|uniref:hypothetical protein n=1 Tax=Streptomyces sp. NPDC089799 TaxID=3155066 RepID=UPI00342BE0B0